MDILIDVILRAGRSAVELSLFVLLPVMIVMLSLMRLFVGSAWRARLDRAPPCAAAQTDWFNRVGCVCRVANQFREFRRTGRDADDDGTARCLGSSHCRHAGDGDGPGQCHDPDDGDGLGFWHDARVVAARWSAGGGRDLLPVRPEAIRRGRRAGRNFASRGGEQREGCARRDQSGRRVAEVWRPAVLGSAAGIVVRTVGHALFT